MVASEFFLYCAGVSTVLVSSAAAVRLARTVRAVPARPEPRWQPILEDPEDQAVTGLASRLKAVQGARYASPIVQRSLPDDALDQRRGRSFEPRKQPQSPKKEG